MANRLIYGNGIMDVEGIVTLTSKVSGKHKIIWICPYYKKWTAILERCFSKAAHIRHPSYTECKLHKDWLYFSNFIKWVDSQPNRNWKNCEPDKDLLITDNKLYGPDTVVFVESRVNGFLIDSKVRRGAHMLGAHKPKVGNKWLASCSSTFEGYKRYIGYFKTELEAHKAWQARKHEIACKLADMQEDERVANALRQRYAPDKDWTKV